MLQIRRLVLDILKPHTPDVLEFARTVAACGDEYEVSLRVLEIDEHTQTLEMIIEAPDIDLDAISSAISEMGGSLHSIDGVDVVNSMDSS